MEEGTVALLHVCYHGGVNAPREPQWGPTTYGESFADVYDEWYGGITDAGATARFVAARADDGPVLELGVGSGRLVGSLLSEGCTVVGIDASEAMLAQALARFAGEPSVSLVQADLGALPLARPRSVGAALCAFNTLFNVASEDGQTELLTRVARLLRNDGCLVIEAITGLEAGPPGSVGVSRLDPDRVVLSATVVDHDAQTLRGQHIDITEAGIKLRPWHLRWATPDQLDAMAADAGLFRAEQYSDWQESPFTSTSPVRIAVYRRRIV